MSCVTKSDILAARATLDKHVPGWFAQGITIQAPSPADGVIVQIGSSVKSEAHAIIAAAEFINWRLTDNGVLDL